MSNAMKGAFGAYSATEIEALGASYGALAGPVVRQGMIHSRRNNMGYAGADCGCGDLALTNPAEGEESWMAKNAKWLWLAGLIGAGYYAHQKGWFEKSADMSEIFTSPRR
jgi:hypothetical protein